jgi:hypothetical protein
VIAKGYVHQVTDILKKGAMSPSESSGYANYGPFSLFNNFSFGDNK